ncbi:pfh1, partial [Symbiodinium microadriaticum]
MLYPECLVGLEALWNWRRPKTEVDEVDGRGSAFLKAKLNWDRARFWDADGQPLECPGDLAGRLAKVHVELRQVWLMSPQCGLLLEVTDPQLREAAPQAETEPPRQGASYSSRRIRLEFVFPLAGQSPRGRDELGAAARADPPRRPGRGQAKDLGAGLSDFAPRRAGRAVRSAHAPQRRPDARRAALLPARGPEAAELPVRRGAAPDPRGRSDYILLRSGVKKLVRTLAPDGNYHLTKLGKAFFREKYTEWLAHVPVCIRGRRKNGRSCERQDYLPVSSLNVGLQRQNDGLSEAQVDVREAVLQQLGSPGEDDVMSEEVYFLDGSRERTLSSQTTQRIDDRAVVVSYQLFKGDEVLASAFERRPDRLCAARQLAELLRLPLEEVLSDFDTICDRGWQERGITPERWPSRPGRGTRSSTRTPALSAPGVGRAGVRALAGVAAAAGRRGGLRHLRAARAASQLLDLLAPVDRRAVGVGQPREPLHRRPELLGQILQAQAVGLEELQVAHGHLRQQPPDPGHRAVLRRHHEIPGGPARGVAEELRHEDVVPVRVPCRVHEGLAVLAAIAVELVVGGAHQVDQVHVASAQRRQPRRAHVGLAGSGAEAALQRRGLGVLQARLQPVALVAERLEIVDLPAERGAHRHHVVELAGAQRHGRAAELARAALRGQDLLPLLRHLSRICPSEHRDEEADQERSGRRGGRPRGPLPPGPQPAAHRAARRRQDAPREAHRGTAAGGRGRGAAGVQDALRRAEPGPGRADRGPLGAPHGAQRPLPAGLAGGRGGHSDRLRALGPRGLRGAGSRRALPASGGLPAAAGGAGQLRGRPRGEAAEGLRPAAGP